MVVAREPPYGALVSDQTDPDDDVSAEPVPKQRRRRRDSERVAAKTAPSSLFVLIALGAAAAGGAGGWFGHEAQAKAKLNAESAPAAAGSGAPSGPCGAWQRKLCAGNDVSATCAEAKAAVELLTPSTCEAALAAVPATLAKVKAARAQCDTLVGRLCGDLPKGSHTCDMVRERTQSFPPERCGEMIAHYGEVIASLKQMDQAPSGPMHAAGLGQPPGAPGTP
jgi:hypothetical protein